MENDAANSAKDFLLSCLPHSNRIRKAGRQDIPDGARQPARWKRADTTACSGYHGGEVGSTSSYSDRSSAWPSFAGTRTRSSSISPLVKVLRILVTNCPSLRWP